MTPLEVLAFILGYLVTPALAVGAAALAALLAGPPPGSRGAAVELDDVSFFACVLVLVPRFAKGGGRLCVLVGVVPRRPDRSWIGREERNRDKDEIEGADREGTGNTYRRCARPRGSTGR